MHHNRSVFQSSKRLWSKKTFEDPRTKTADPHPKHISTNHSIAFNWFVFFGRILYDGGPLFSTRLDLSAHLFVGEVRCYPSPRLQDDGHHHASSEQGYPGDEDRVVAVLTVNPFALRWCMRTMRPRNEIVRIIDGALRRECDLEWFLEYLALFYLL